MNQILYIEQNKKKKTHSKGKIVLIIFAICVIIIGGFLLGNVVYSSLNNKEEENSSEPLVDEISQEGNIINILVKHDKPIEKIVYKWQNSQETVIPGEGREEIELTIDAPIGTNKLNIKVTDTIGKTVAYNKEYTGEEGDVNKPKIDFTIEGQKIKIIAKDETALSYITYYWNNEDETKIEASADDTKQIEENIDILKGENTLTVIATDIAGNSEKIEQKYKGSKRPKISATQEGTDLVIKVTDEQGIQKIDYNLNGKLYSSDPQETGAPLGRNEVEFKQPLEEGENKIDIKVYNVDGLEAEFTWEGTSNQ